MVTHQPEDILASKDVNFPRKYCTGQYVIGDSHMGGPAQGARDNPERVPGDCQLEAVTLCFITPNKVG